jgi:hypothetical protein
LVFTVFAYNNFIPVIEEMTPLMAAEGRLMQIETATPQLSSKPDRVDNPAANE